MDKEFKDARTKAARAHERAAGRAACPLEIGASVGRIPKVTIPARTRHAQGVMR